jgi:CheY-like chemotaxis protein
LKVLIVDDDLQIQKAYKAICENQGWDALIARDGVEALEKLEENPDVDVILLDIIMPRMNGIDFLKEVQERRIGLPPTIVMTNSLVSKDSKDKAHQLGAKSYNVKTRVKPSEIVEMINNFSQSDKN